jgi:nucleoside-diphosphate-sugar epimerase
VRVLVTGASGFIGDAACRELVARGHEVLALVRRPGSEPPGTTAVRGDLTAPIHLRDALVDERPECVVHLAAEIASQRDAERVQEVNVAGTACLLEAAEAAGVKRFVFASTVVTGEADGRLLREDEPLPVQTAYGRSKQEGERMLRESSLHGVVVRPGHVYGPGGWYADEFVRRLQQPGRFCVIGRGDNLWDVVHVDDVATALADAAERGADGAVFHVADDEPLTFYDFVKLTADELGVGAPRRIPQGVARMFAGRDPVTAVVRSARTSNERIKRELGWQPRFASARTGVPDAIARLQSAPAAAAIAR